MKLIESIKDTLTEFVPKIKKKIVVITGYVTIEAFEFLEALMPNDSIEKIILFKFNLIDFHNKSSSFNFRKAIDNGWKVYVDSSIHAKNYIFDDEVIIQGSFNLTTASLGIRTNNLRDNGIMVDYYEDINKWVENKLATAMLVTLEMLNQLETFLEAINVNISIEVVRAKQTLLERNIFIKTHSGLEQPSSTIADKIRLKQLADCFIESFKESPKLYGEYMSEDNFKKIYEYSDNDFWNNYVIDLKVSPNASKFDLSNNLYSLTPKIYKNNCDYYIQPLMRNEELLPHKNLVIETALHTLECHLMVDLSLDNIFIYKDSFRTTVKFKRFLYLDDLESKKEIVLDYYKNNFSLLFNNGNGGV